MFRNRELSIRLRKAKEADPERSENDKIFEDRVALVHTAVEDVVMKIVLGICIFVAVDTVRQVAIERSVKLPKN